MHDSLSAMLSRAWFCYLLTSRSRDGSDAAPDHPRRVAVGAAGHSEDRLVHQQQRWGEIQAAGEGEQGAAKDHPGGEDSVHSTLYRHSKQCYDNIVIIKYLHPKDWYTAHFHIIYHSELVMETLYYTYMHVHEDTHTPHTLLFFLMWLLHTSQLNLWTHYWYDDNNLKCCDVHVVMPVTAAHTLLERSLITDLYRKNAPDLQVQGARTREYLAFFLFLPQ